MKEPSPSAEAELAQRSGTSGRPARRRRAGWNFLLLIPVFAVVVPALYARVEPRLFGFPFFYWFQFAGVIVAALITGAVYLLADE